MRKFAIRLTSSVLFATMIFATVFVVASRICSDRVSEAKEVESKYSLAATAYGTSEFDSLNLAADKFSREVVFDLFFVSPRIVSDLKGNISSARSEAEYASLSKEFTTKLLDSTIFDVIIARILEGIVGVLYAAYLALSALVVKDTVLKRKGGKDGKRCVYRNV